METQKQETKEASPPTSHGFRNALRNSRLLIGTAAGIIGILTGASAAIAGQEDRAKTVALEQVKLVDERVSTVANRVDVVIEAQKSTSQDVRELKGDFHEVRVDIQELYRAMPRTRRSDRLETPLAPPDVKEE